MYVLTLLDLPLFSLKYLKPNRQRMLHDSVKAGFSAGALGVAFIQPTIEAKITPQHLRVPISSAFVYRKVFSRTKSQVFELKPGEKKNFLRTRNGLGQFASSLAKTCQISVTIWTEGIIIISDRTTRFEYVQCGFLASGQSRRQ